MICASVILLPSNYCNIQILNWILHFSTDSLNYKLISFLNCWLKTYSNPKLSAVWQQNWPGRHIKNDFSIMGHKEPFAPKHKEKSWYIIA